MTTIAKLALAASAAALMLSACGGGSSTPTPTASESAGPSGPAAGMTPLSANSDLPGPKPGLWKMTITSMGQTLPAQETCVEKAMSFQEAQEMQKQVGVTCSEQSFKKEGDTVIGRSVCTMDMGGKPTTITSDTKITGDYNSKYTMEVVGKMDPAPMPQMAETSTTIVAERVGDCTK